jgi:hypothetical protein
LFDPHLEGEVVKLFSSAMNHADTYSHLMKQGKLFGERAQVLAVFGGLTRKLDHKRLPLEPLDVRQRFTK